MQRPTLRSLDLEKGPEESFNYQNSFNETTRVEFIRKVYGILAVQLLITFAGVYLAMHSRKIRMFLFAEKGSMVMMWIALAAMMVTTCVITCSKDLARQVPCNYICLFLFTLAQTYFLAMTCVFTADPDVVMLAILLTVGIVVALSIYACATPFDLSWGMGLVAVLTGATFMMIPFAMFRQWEWMYYVGCFIGLVVFGVYLYHDTQMLVKDNPHNLSVDDYVLGAMIIYMDIIQIFIKILQLLSKSKK